MQNNNQTSFFRKRFSLQIVTSFIMITATLILFACSRQSDSVHGKIVTIKPKPFANTLFYSGIIQPRKTVVITCPADGAVVEMAFQYGEYIKAGELIFLISSTKFLQDYKTGLMAYIKAKSEFNTAQMQLNEYKFLHTNQLISDDEYKMKQSNYYGARLALLQAKDTLKSLLQQLDIKNVDLYKLTIADFDKIVQALNLKIGSESLRVVAPTSGVILSPSKGEEENKKIVKGDVIKQGDVLAIIGDMTGLSVRIKVNELTVNQLKVGQKVKVTGLAFSEHELSGQIMRIDRQGETASGGMPTFSVQVIVPNLTKQQQKEIHVGMSAKVKIDIEGEEQIAIPMQAIKEKNGSSYVQIFDKKTKQTRDLLVQTGKTTVDSVAIIAGLKSGDNIVIPD